MAGPRKRDKSLHDVDPLTQPTDSAPSGAGQRIALAAEDPPAALTLFDEARLLSPERWSRKQRFAARSDRAEGRRRSFSTSSTQYVAPLPHSPYASQFADAFVIGVVAMHDSMELDKVAATLNEMDADRRKFIYLRLARKSATTA